MNFHSRQLIPLRLQQRRSIQRRPYRPYQHLSRQRSRLSLMRLSGYSLGLRRQRRLSRLK
jgi:hypothetical protein